MSLITLTYIIVSRTVLGFVSRYTTRSSSLQWRQQLLVAFLQAARGTLNQRYTFAQSRLQLTGVAVKKYCDTHKLTHTAVNVAAHSETTASVTGEDSSPSITVTLHVVTPTDAPALGPTLVYTHGGGYLNPLQAAGHMPFALSCAAACGARRLVIVEYALTTEHVYPAQLVQMVAAVKHLLQHGTVAEGGALQPDDLVLAGDSAGGHLIASLLAHIARPSPHAPPLPEVGGGQGQKPLRGVVMVSPWVTMRTTDASFTANHDSDFLSAQQLEIFTRHFSPAPGEVWACPLEADGAAAVWDDAFPRAAPGGAGGETATGIVKKTLVTAGAAETLFDSCVKFAGELLHADMTVLGSGEQVAADVSGKDVVLTIAPDEVHVQPILDSAIGYAEGASTKAIMAFLKSV